LCKNDAGAILLSRLLARDWRGKKDRQTALQQSQGRHAAGSTL